MTAPSSAKTWRRAHGRRLLPLAMAFAIASGCSPPLDLDGHRRRFHHVRPGRLKGQIGGPTGAFIPIVHGIVAAHGFANLPGATVLPEFFCSPWVLPGLGS